MTVMKTPIEQPFHTRRLVTLLFALAVLLPSLYGFGTKFLEFVALYRGDVDGVFAISPILNYLLASFGFLLLFGWAALGGMFRDIEGPKYTLLENEARLDRTGPDADFPFDAAWSINRARPAGLGTSRTNHRRDYDDHD